MTRRLSTWQVNDTTLTILGDVTPAHFPEPQRLALVAWLEHHVNDPAIEYDVFERDDEGRWFPHRDASGRPDPDLGYVRRRHRIELDEAPLPFPDEFQVRWP